MARKQKAYVNTTIRLRADLASKLEEHHKETGVPKTFTIEKALSEYFSRKEGGSV